MDEFQSTAASLRRMEGLTDRQIAVLSAEMTSRRRTAGVAYVLWFFLGGLGAHNFYLGRSANAVAQLALCILGWLTVVVFIGFPILFVLYTWVIVDAFRIPRFIMD